ncbi:ubiquitin carboxyl-terminal hydrolase 8 [Ixodes scapularis]
MTVAGEQLSAAVPDESRSLFGRRDLVDFVILIDWRSRDVPSVPTVPLRVLKDAIWKWCTSKHLRSEPMVLIGGYEDWLLRYPMHTTYPHPRIPTPPGSPHPPDLGLAIIDFPDLDRDFEQKAPSSQQNATPGNHGLASGSGNGSWQLMPSVDRTKKPNVPNGPTVVNDVSYRVVNGTSLDSLADTPKANIPQVDRALKPGLGGPFGRDVDVGDARLASQRDGRRTSSPSGDDEAPSRASALGQELLDLTKDQLAFEQKFELLRERRAREAEEGIRQVLQEQEEALRERIRLTEKAMRDKEQEVNDLTRSNALFQQQLQEKDRELERIIRLQEEQKKAEKELKRMREERKHKEQKEKEEAERRKGAVAPDKASARTRKQVSTTGDVSQDRGGQGENSASKHSSPTAWKSSGLSRSRSFPNLSTAAEEEVQQLAERQPDTSVIPGFDRTLKPSQSVEAPSASISRQSRVRPNDLSNSRVRSISPSSGREIKRLAGLKNLGNTCYMNATLQCLANTVPLALHFLSGKYHADINRLDALSPEHWVHLDIWIKRLAGLKNLGNTCYMNATLQCLANTVPLALHFLSGKYHADINRESRRGTGGEAANEFKNLVAQMYYNDKSVAPKSFKSLMGRLFNVYAGYEQQDAHEFLLNLIDKLHEDLNKANQRRVPPASLPPADEASLSLSARINRFWNQHTDRHLSVISDLFEGLLASTLTCLSCHKSSSSFEAFSCLSLPIPHGGASGCYLQDCLKLFLETEKMSGEAAWDCPSCKQKRKAEKRMIIARLPKILIVQFNRFRCEAAWQSKKLQTYVHFPVNNFDMNQYVDHTRLETQKRPPYNLYAFLNHYGTLATGHYIAYCRAGIGSSWFMYDDASVTEVVLSESDKKNAYILFYTSVDIKHQFTCAC